MNGNPSKRIDTQFSEASYEVIKRAAENSGASVRSFAAQAIMREALSIVERYENVLHSQLPEVKFTDKEREEVWNFSSIRSFLVKDWKSY